MVPQLDVTDVPVATVPCMRNVCNQDESVSSLPVPAGTPCDLEHGHGVCDGTNGVCRECLVSNDCASGQVCAMFACVTAPCSDCDVPTCSDKRKNGDETDIDCGGSCDKCPAYSPCLVDQDCASDACHPIMLRCESPSCIDQTRDDDESDVDCGGSCIACYIGKHCFSDRDCSTGHCSAALGNVCNGNPCADNVADGDETDVDCGGSTCGPCHAGQRCASPYDCDTFCDPATLRCTQ